MYICVEMIRLKAFRLQFQLPRYQRDNQKKMQTCKMRVPTVTCPYNVLILFFSIKNFKTCMILNQLALSYEQQRDIEVLLYNWHDMNYMTLPTIVKVRMNTTCTIISSKHAHIYKKKSPLWEMKGLKSTLSSFVLSHLVWYW